MKDAYYFPHDANAHDDPKIQKLLMETKSSGYGVFWIVVELLRSEPNYKLEKSSYHTIAYQSHSDEQTVKSVIEDFNLFEMSETHFWSESLMRRMISMEEKRKKLSEAGKRGNSIRWSSGGDRKAIAVKESKVNNIKHSSPKGSLTKNALPVVKHQQVLDIEFINSLKVNVAYKDLDVDKELGKMDAWLSTRPRRKKTRRFIINWLINATENHKEVKIERKPNRLVL